MANPKKGNGEGTSNGGGLSTKKAIGIGLAGFGLYKIYSDYIAPGYDVYKYSAHPTADDGIDLITNATTAQVSFLPESTKNRLMGTDRLKDTAKEQKDHADFVSHENVSETLDKLEKIGNRVKFGDGPSSAPTEPKKEKPYRMEERDQMRLDLPSLFYDVESLNNSYNKLADNIDGLRRSLKNEKDLNTDADRKLNSDKKLEIEKRSKELEGYKKQLEEKRGELQTMLDKYKEEFGKNGWPPSHSDYNSNGIPDDIEDGFDPERYNPNSLPAYKPKGEYLCLYSPPIQGQDSCYAVDKFAEAINGGKVFINNYDPIVLDLNGDGKISINKRTNSNVYFDYSGDGTSIKTSWVGKEDGILVFDKNNDGKINDGSELLGNFTQKSDGSTTKHGYDALSLLDSNKDGVIDAKDEGFVNLKVWQDANSNGIVDEGEMKKLSELNISSLNLTHQTENKNLEDRNKITHVGSYTMTDGSSRTMADVEFSVLPSDSKVKVDEKYIKNHITGVNVGGTGRLADLAIAANISNDLSGLLCMYDMLDSKEKQMGILDELLYEWAKTDSKFNSYNIELLKAQEVSQGEVDSKTTIISLTPSQARSFREQMANGCKDEALLSRFESSKRKIQVVSAMMGMDLSKHYYSTDERLRQFLDMVDSTYDNLKSGTYRILLPQTRLKEYMERLYVIVDRDGNFSYNSSRVIDKFKEINLSDPKKAFVDLAEFATLFQSKKDFAAGLSLLAEFAYGANKRGVLSEYLDALGKDMQSKINITTSSSGSAGDDIMVGSDGNDALYGEGGNSILYGGDGDDKLYGNNSSDILEGGAGNDYLEGGNGDDTYIFRKGDGADTIYDLSGNDTIKFGEGISLNDLIVKRADDNINNLEISIKGTEDKITIKDVYWNGGRNYYNGRMMENFEFADGTKLSFSEFQSQTYFKGTDANDTIMGANSNDEIYGGAGDDTLIGQDGDDILYGGAGNDALYGEGGNSILYGGDGDDKLYGNNSSDILEGGAGNDYLEGGNGDDTYIFRKGDGADTIYDLSGNDTIRFKEGVSKENITFQRVANDLVLKYGDNDTVRINNQFGGSSIEQIALASGEYITASKINKIIEDLNAYAANNGMSNISMDDMKNNPDIMQMFASGWGN